MVGEELGEDAELEGPVKVQIEVHLRLVEGDGNQQGHGLFRLLHGQRQRLHHLGVPPLRRAVAVTTQRGKKRVVL